MYFMFGVDLYKKLHRQYYGVKSVHLLIALLSVAILAEAWDTWWHRAIGHDTFFDPPHTLLYVSVVLALIVAFYLWRWGHVANSKYIFLSLLLLPISVPLDELWQGLFSVGNSTNSLIIWAPMRLLVVFGITAAMLLLLSVLRHERKRLDHWLFMVLGFGSLLWLGFFVLIPLSPYGPFHIIGLWGTVFVSFVFCGVLLFAQRFIKGPEEVLPITVIFLLMLMVGTFEGVSSSIYIPSFGFAESPHWLTAFTFLLAALSIEVLKKIPPSLSGAIAGFVWALPFYLVAPYFTGGDMLYSNILSIAIAVLSSVVGGLAAGIAAKMLIRGHFGQN